jgi:hypothetical protein
MLQRCFLIAPIMEAANTSETFVNFYQTTQSIYRHISLLGLINVDAHLLQINIYGKSKSTLETGLLKCIAINYNFLPTPL